MPVPTLVFDGDCAFCARCADAARRILPADCAVTPWQSFDLAAVGVTPERAQREVLWVGADGAVTGGAPAVARALRAAAGVWRVLRLVGVLLSLPPVRWVAPPVYRLVAANRHRLPGGAAACRVVLPPPEPVTGSGRVDRS
ncbi:thiol-disulfide oxidoreductase DCC family protein [Blastococcus xanthinilyticus]|uniref:Putative DCC family thiol-disulfide oxidoreductase YuxK n=1 Tax=Blastococcus xanthinilyticus TaxID=1564164 RepID=A0A5S5CSX3_9ACTN|nr:DCC1-like thiol-disulfide oxidoreductase family protein [Blastococcus xanthinilyticus]TYP86823.1 putative DCC family thiol-disulfide oxidoreductase YuxK [Blastococcus xanthinilyticus]